MSKILNSTFKETKTELSENQLYSKTSFQLITTEKEIDDAGNVRVYGISISSSDDTFQIENISANACIVISLLKLLEENECSPLHIYDIIDDLLDSLI